MTLKFSDIAIRTQLSTYTAQHVLKSVLEELDLPRAGAQGVHRTFSLQQAVRFALATKLAMAGVSIRQVEAIVRLCERRVGGPSRRPDKPLYQSVPNWFVTILNDDLVQVSFPQDRHNINLADPDEYYSLAAKMLINVFNHSTMIRLRGEYISKHEINLTLLEKMLIEP